MGTFGREEAVEAARIIIERDTREMFMAIYAFPERDNDVKEFLLELVHTRAVHYQDKYSKLTPKEIFKEKMSEMIDELGEMYD